MKTNADITVTAHTGCMDTVPNSLDSIVKGFEIGSDIVEIDIRFSSDGDAIMSHNALSSDEEKHAVRLADAFDVIKKYPDRKVNLDIKETSGVSTIEKLADQKGILNQIFFTGVFQKDVSAVKRGTSKIKYYLNLNPVPILSNFEPYLHYIAAKTKRSGAIGINLNKSGCTKKLVELFHSRGLLVSVWTITDRDGAKKYIAMNPDNITCKNPDEVMQLLGNN